MADRRHCILGRNHELVDVSLEEWALWMEGHDSARRVGRDQVGDFFVSTVFLGLDHCFGIGPALWFETMIWRDDAHRVQRDFLNYQERYTTWDQAVAGHQRAIEFARTQLP